MSSGVGIAWWLTILSRTSLVTYSRARGQVQARFNFFARQSFGFAHQKARPIARGQSAQRAADQLGTFIAQHFAFRIVTVAGQQCRGRHWALAMLIASATLGTLEW